MVAGGGLLTRGHWDGRARHRAAAGRTGHRAAADEQITV